MERAVQVLGQSKLETMGFVPGPQLAAVRWLGAVAAGPQRLRRRQVGPPADTTGCSCPEGTGSAESAVLNPTRALEPCYTYPRLPLPRKL